MPTLLFIHSAGAQGAGEGSSALVQGLQRQLPAGWTIGAPLMPEPDSPQPDLWLPAIAAALGRQTEPFVAVGHSLGGSSLLQQLAAQGLPERLMGVVLLGVPFWGLPGWDFDGYEAYALPRDAGERLRGLRAVVIVRGEEDDTATPAHVERYRSVLPQAEARILPGVDHGAADAAGAVIAAAEAIFGR